MWLTKREVAFFVSFFFLLFLVGSKVLLTLGLALFIFFVLKRKEIYFLFCFISPRITGYAPLLDYMLSLAREEGPGNKEVGDLLRIDIPGVKPLFFIFKPEYLKRVLSTEAHSFPSRGHEGAIVKMTYGNGESNIFISEGPPSAHWGKFRELTSAINKDRFGPTSVLAQLFDATWKTTQEMAQEYDQKRGVAIDLFLELYKIMIPAHNYALFGEDVAKKYSYQDLAIEIHDVLNEIGRQVKFPYAPASVESVLQRQIKRISDVTRNMAKETASPFIANFVDATKKGLLTEEELHSNLLVFEYAQAPLPVVFWALYLLALHPEEERKVVHEIAQVLSKGPLTHARLGEFKYLARVVTETMRLYPSVGLMQPRFAGKNSMFGNHFVPEGSFVLLCQYIANRNAGSWKDPDTFNPMREGLDTTHTGDTLKHFPFGFGPRQCQGQYFATDFVKVTIISLLQYNKLEVVKGQKPAVPTEMVFLRPNYPVYFTFSKRVLPAAELPDEEAKVEEKQTHHKKKKPPVMLSRSKTNVMAFQSTIFKSSLISLGKHKNVEKDLLVLYASQSGQAQGFANRIVHMANLCKIAVDILSMADVNVANIPKYKTVIVATSTFGDGGPPENGGLFNAWLEKETSTDLWKGINYAVLSLGSSMYPCPFKFGKYVSLRFSQLGATKILNDKHLDEIKYNQQEEFTKWSMALFESLAKNTHESSESQNLIARNRLLGFQDFDFNVTNAPFRLAFTDKHLKLEARVHFGASTMFSTVVTNELVTKIPSNKIYSLDLQFPESSSSSSSSSYQAGDNVAVYPPNDVGLVKRLLGRLGIPRDQVFNVEQEIGQTDICCSLGKNKCTPEIALTYFYDILTPPSTSLLQFFAFCCDDEADQETLNSYVKNYRPFLLLERTPLDVLEDFPSIEPFKDPKKVAENFAIFLGLLGALRPRYYSIASSPETSPNHLRIVYKAVRYKSKHGHEKEGLCSTFMEQRKPGDQVPISIVKSRFKLPSDSTVPIVMVGAGSGISPYFSFVEQRQHAQQNGDKLGKAILIHGCRTEGDFALKGKIDSAISSNLISDLWPAYSKRENTKSEHVQDIIEQKGDILWELIEKENAIIYICGDLKVGTAVRDAFMKLARVHGNMGIFKANSWILKLAASGRLRHDEWGVGTTNGENVIRAARLRLWRKSITVVLSIAKKHQKLFDLRKARFTSSRSYFKF